MHLCPYFKYKEICHSFYVCTISEETIKIVNFMNGLLLNDTKVKVELKVLLPSIYIVICCLKKMYRNSTYYQNIDYQNKDVRLTVFFRYLFFF